MRIKIEKVDKKRKYMGWRWKGSYTVETALLMGILLPVLFGILWAACLLYEQGFLQGAVSESVFAENMRLEESEQKTGEHEMNRQSIGKAKLSFYTTWKDQKIVSEGMGYAVVPGMAGVFFYGGTVSWKVQEENSWADGTKRIRDLCQKKALSESEGTG